MVLITFFSITGDVFAPTSKNPPFNVVNNKIYNRKFRESDDDDDFADMFSEKHEKEQEEYYKDILEQFGMK
jgi:hypothetical protein